tara:strand:+ start:2109 stop:2594 length:486 start_codon:yes stop_codon:yes gene_type:complete
MTNLRIGFGYDFHRLKPGLNLILGSVEIPHFKGVVAHSDGDILIHSIADALLGAAALGDIGLFFPDNDLKNKNIDSAIILSTVIKKLNERSFKIVNIDSTILLEKPKLQPFITRIRSSLSNLLSISLEQINIKATTGEGMGPVGKQDGIACYVTVLIEKMQ